MSSDTIQIIGARQHNLKNIDVNIPRNQLVVMTGLSGSGKSSLAFNTLFAEGQRRFVESLSSYARQFIEQLEKPDVDFIEGLSPAIAIQQRQSNPTPRSTTATATEIYDYLRILFAAVGVPYVPATGAPLRRDSPQEIVDRILALPPRTKIIVLAPDIPVIAGQYERAIEDLLKQGFVRAQINGEIQELESAQTLQGEPPDHLDVVVDRITLAENSRSRLFDSIETALRLTVSFIDILAQYPGQTEWEHVKYSTTFSNPETGFTMPRLSPKHFSFNSHLGACSKCHGLGSELVCDPRLLVPDDSKSLNEGAIKSWWARNKKLKVVQDRQILALAEHHSVDLDAPFLDLPEKFTDALFRGTGEIAIKSGWKAGAHTRGLAKPFEGLAVQAERLFSSSKSEFTKRNVRRYLAYQPCSSCRGKRLKREMLCVKIAQEGGAKFNIQEVTALDFHSAREWLTSISLNATQSSIAAPLLAELHRRLGFLIEVGLGYLSLDRESSTLSGGETQRIRLASQLGSALAGVLYVLDEPTIGLHPADTAKLIRTLRDLRDLGNSVIVVEHDADTISSADHIIELGPGAGPEGGAIVAEGSLVEISKNENSLTGAFLTGRRAITPPASRVAPAPHPDPLTLGAPDSPFDTGWIEIKAAREHNLKGVDASIPLGCLVCVTGVSGSGKSTLLDSILMRSLFRRLHGSGERPGEHGGIAGLQQIDKAIVIDQSPIGRNPRSNPVTFVGAFAPIRELFSQLPAARARGYAPGRFSFNVAGGRCESCQGAGAIVIDMHFLNDMYVTCETCAGTRYQREVLDIRYKGKSIADVLAMTVSEAAEFFAAVPSVATRLDTLKDVGLGYVKLGQSGTTLSGGEAQRVKLASELSKRATGKTLYFLDEPTTGLHFADVDTLLKVLYRLRDSGNSLLVIEHNMDVVRCADWVIDMGPGGGPNGGLIVAAGPPERIAEHPSSPTGKALRAQRTQSP